MWTLRERAQESDVDGRSVVRGGGGQGGETWKV